MAELTEVEWTQAITALDPNNYIEVEAHMLVDDLTPESYYLIKETINSVSKEASSVFKILANIPSELLQEFTPMKLRNLLKDMGWTRRKTNKVLNAQ